VEWVGQGGGRGVGGQAGEGWVGWVGRWVGVGGGMKKLPLLMKYNLSSYTDWN
jgi:hypothetical protein